MSRVPNVSHRVPETASGNVSRVPPFKGHGHGHAAPDTGPKGERFPTIRLDDDQLAHLAELIADRLAVNSQPELIDAAELADRIGRTRAYVYDNAARLGAIRVGDGPRPRLTFRWPHVLDRLADSGRSRNPEPVRRPVRSRRATVDVELLPIRAQS